MPGLFNNAVLSIQLGVEDYKANDTRRSVSAVRNFYAGLLLLAKEVLVRVVPDAAENQIIAARYKPVPNGFGGVNYVPESEQTIDLRSIGKRFKDFGLIIDHAALEELSRIRNDIEHRYPKVPDGTMRQAMAKAFPVAAQLFRLTGEEPLRVLGSTWDAMLELNAVYEQELEACRATFHKIQWRSTILEELTFICPECNSDLVEQDDPENSEQQEAEAHCRSCGARINIEIQVASGIAAQFLWQNYFAITDGGYPPVHGCPECGLSTYVVTDEETGCVWCGLSLDKCVFCTTGLMPDNVDPNDHDLCGHCGNLMTKDD